MYVFSVDPQPWLIAAVILIVILAVVERYRSTRRHNRNQEVRQTLRRFAKIAQQNGHPEASGAYDNASHIVGLMLERGVNVEPELQASVTWVPEGTEAMSVTKGTSRIAIGG
jgi:TPR repeat protein